MNATVRRLLPLAAWAVIGVTIFLLPFLLLLAPNPRPIAVGSLSAGGLGAYVGREPRLLKVFPKAALDGVVPPNLPHVGPDAHIYVKDKVLDTLGMYTITRVSAAARVPVSRTVLRPNQLEITPRSELAPGTYVASIPRSNIYGGTDYYYFVVDAR